MDGIYKRIGNRIRVARRRTEMRQDELAQKTALSRGSISNIESGRQQLYVHHLYAIASALDIEPASLLAPPNPPPIPEDSEKLKDALAAVRKGVRARSRGRISHEP